MKTTIENTAGSDSHDRPVHPLFLAESERDGVEEIHDLYWFEESGVHDLSGDGHHGSYKIKATVETLVTLMQRMTDDERMDVMGEFCRHCGDSNDGRDCPSDTPETTAMRKLYAAYKQKVRGEMQLGHFDKGALTLLAEMKREHPTLAETAAMDDAACSSGTDRFRPDNVNPMEFRCRDCEEWHGMSSEHCITNGQWGVSEGRRRCVVRCFCRKCWERRRDKHYHTNG